MEGWAGHGVKRKNSKIRLTKNDIRAKSIYRIKTGTFVMYDNSKPSACHLRLEIWLERWVHIVGGSESKIHTFIGAYRLMKLTQMSDSFSDGSSAASVEDLHREDVPCSLRNTSVATANFCRILKIKSYDVPPIKIMNRRWCRWWSLLTDVSIYPLDLDEGRNLVVSDSFSPANTRIIQIPKLISHLSVPLNNQ